MTFAEAIPRLLQGKILQSIHAGGWKIKMVDGVLVDVTHGYPSISGHMGLINLGEDVE